MDRTTTSLSTPAERPSGLRAFMGGFGTGAFNGSLMMGIFAGVSAIAGGAVLTLSGAAIAIIATGIFSGVMAIKRAFTETADEHATAATHTTHSPVLVPTVGHAMAPSMDMVESQEMDNSRRTDWAEHTGQRSNNMQQILANGAMSDKDRASAILAERERSAGTSASLN
jgi:hypothetical protein